MYHQVMNRQIQHTRAMQWSVTEPHRNPDLRNNLSKGIWRIKVEDQEPYHILPLVELKVGWTEGRGGLGLGAGEKSDCSEERRGGG